MLLDREISETVFFKKCVGLKFHKLQIFQTWPWLHVGNKNINTRYDESDEYLRRKQGELRRRCPSVLSSCRIRKSDRNAHRSPNLTIHCNMYIFRGRTNAEARSTLAVQGTGRIISLKVNDPTSQSVLANGLCEYFLR